MTIATFIHHNNQYHYYFPHYYQTRIIEHLNFCAIVINAIHIDEKIFEFQKVEIVLIMNDRF